MPGPNFRIDFVGDIHGHLNELDQLLKQLGYYKSGDRWHHDHQRTLFFVGDFIDRGPQNVATVFRVRELCDCGVARAILGNHELNALAFHTMHKGQWLRVHSERNLKQHNAFLAEVDNNSARRDEVLDFFRTLPMLHDAPEFRVVHACWSEAEVETLRTLTKGSFMIDSALLAQAYTRGTTAFEIVEILAKGKEIKLDYGDSFKDKDGNERYAVRTKWWQADNLGFKDIAMSVPEDELERLADTPVDSAALSAYPPDAPPVFFGHYWFSGTPAPVAPNAACLDYSVARSGGKLCAYRWDGETVLQADKFSFVQRD